MPAAPLNALSAFVAVARRLSYAEAAKALGVSTSALSQSVRQLEKRLGLALLLRNSRSVALTDAGKTLLLRAGPAVDQALLALGEVADLGGEVRGVVRLTVPSVAVSLILTELLPRFHLRHPNVEVAISVNDRKVDAVTEGFDGGIRLAEAIERDMVHVRLTPPGQCLVVGAPAYLRRAGAPRVPEDLLGHACIGVRWAVEQNPWAWELERGPKRWRLAVQGPVTTNDGGLRRRMAVAGVGLAYVYGPAVTKELAAGQLQVVLADYAPQVPGLFLYFPSRAHMSSAFRAFVGEAKAWAKTAGRNAAAGKPGRGSRSEREAQA